MAAAPIYQNIADLRFTYVPAWTYNNAVELNNVQSTTRAETDGQLVGTMTSYSRDCHMIGAQSSVTRPTVVSGNGQSTWHRYNGAQTTWVENWAGAFAFFHTTGVFWIGTVLRPTSFAATQVLMENNNNTTASAGISVRITTLGRINVFINNGTAGQQNWNLTSSNSMTLNAENFVQIFADATTLTINVNGTLTTGTRANSLGSANPPFALTFGRSNSATNNLTSDIGWLAIANAIPSSTIRAQYMTWKPARTAANPYPAWSGGDMFTAHGWGNWRCFDSAYVSTATGSTVPVTANGDQVQSLRHYGNAQLGLNFNRHFIKIGTGNPRWEVSSGLANFGTVRFGFGADFTSPDNTQSLRIGAGPNPTMPHPLNWTRTVIWRNRGATDKTSHILVGPDSTIYFVVTDDGYSAGSNPRVVAHDTNASGLSSGNTYMRNGTKFNLFELSSVARTRELYVNGVRDPDFEVTADSLFNYDRIGGGGIVDFYAKGNIAFVGCYPWKITSTERAEGKSYAESYLGYGP